MLEEMPNLLPFVHAIHERGRTFFSLAVPFAVEDPIGTTIGALTNQY